MSLLTPRPAVIDRALPSHDVNGAEPLVLPAAWTAPARPPVPILASIVPLAGAMVLWQLTGSMLSLWFALLGPLIAVATLFDARRAAERARRRARVDAARTHAIVAAEVQRRHVAEREALWNRHPDVAGYLARADAVWRPRASARLVIGRGEVVSEVRVAGGEGDADAAVLRARATRLAGAPVLASPGVGIAVVGPDMLAEAVQRALVIQLCLAVPPGELSVSAPLDDAAWLGVLPHRHAAAGMRLAVLAPEAPVDTSAGLVIARRRVGEPVPPGCGIVLTITSPRHAVAEVDGHAIAVEVEGISREQAGEIATLLAERAEVTLGLHAPTEGPVRLSQVHEAAAGLGGLSAAIGACGGVPLIIDLVEDGPHAVVTGATGTGKSELLITWVAAMALAHSPRDVNFLLADFKGGTAFDSLAHLPHVTGVITDLDGSGARRAIESLRAEVRWREETLARAGARDVADPRVQIARLVIVVDEFAALLGDHPELGVVFTDIAARGRALGMHLVLGTQRAIGVIRDSVLANAPLRISLRVADVAESRALLGTDDAALLPGGAAGRGRALVRRASDAAPHRVAVALTRADDLDAIPQGEGEGPRRPWLPALPAKVLLTELASPMSEGDLVLGMADEPEAQRQRAVALTRHDRSVLAVGGPGSGKSNLIALVEAQVTGPIVRISADAEEAWDAVTALASYSAAPGTVVVIDDLDALLRRYSGDWALHMIEALEQVIRAAPAAGVLIVATVQRVSGAVARLADLFAQRLILGLPSRAEHIAAGGDPTHYAPDACPGRGRWQGAAVQLALAPAVVHPASVPAEEWMPTRALTGFVARRSPLVRAAVGAWEAAGVRVVSLEDYHADPAVVAQSPVIVVGEPDEWQRHWRLLSDLRGDQDLIVDASCAAELRILAAVRTIAPYCEPGRTRAWLISAGADPRRIVLPSGTVGTDRVDLGAFAR